MIWKWGRALCLKKMRCTGPLNTFVFISTLKTLKGNKTRPHIVAWPHLTDIRPHLPPLACLPPIFSLPPVFSPPSFVFLCRPPRTPHPPKTSLAIHPLSLPFSFFAIQSGATKSDQALQNRIAFPSHALLFNHSLFRVG